MNEKLTIVKNALSNRRVISLVDGSEISKIVEPYLIKENLGEYFIGSNIHILEAEKSNDDRILPEARPFIFKLSEYDIIDTYITYTHNRVIESFIFENLQKQYP